jgi:hypothetical protein
LKETIRNIVFSISKAEFWHAQNMFVTCDAFASVHSAATGRFEPGRQ